MGVTDTDVAAAVLAAIAETEKDAREMQAVYPSPWELSDRGWMAHVTADGPHFHEVTRLDQQQAPDGGWLGGVLSHLTNNQPAATLIRCEADRELVEEYIKAGKAYDADPDAFQSGYTAGLWFGLKRLARVYGVEVSA